MSEVTPQRLSWSRIRAYLTCSLQYWFRWIAGQPMEFTPGALAFGSALHRAWEEALIGKLGGQDLPVAELVGVFNTTLDEATAEAPIRWSSRETRESATLQAAAMLEVWLAHPRSGRILAVEESFEIELTPWLLLSGRIDLIEETDDGFVLLTDLKTARSSWGEGDVLRGMDQLILYREGVRPLLESIGKPVKLAWEILLKQKVPRLERVELPDRAPSAGRAIRVASVVQEAIEQKIFVPSPGIHCEGCPYKVACRAW